MLSITDVKKLYEKYNVSASKRFGQNFLIDKNIIEKIVDASDAKGNNVIEIGPGLGSLTYALLPIVKKLTAFEIDNDMIKVLEGEVKDKKFILRHEDFLKAEISPENNVIVANIPYNITSDIIFKLLKLSNSLKSATLMVQKEVADRIVARVGDKEYGKLAVSVQSIADVERVININPKSFIPAPKVFSSVVKLTFKNDYDKDLLIFIKKSFAFRRKTIANNWKQFIDKEVMISIFSKLNIEPKLRPENLSLKQFQKAFTIFNSNE